MNGAATFHDGGCTCRFVRYRMTTKPLFVHGCHCRWCQRETGAAFALNAMIEPDRFPIDVHIFTASKQPRVVLPSDRPAVAEYYSARKLWPKESFARRAALAKSKRTAPRGRR